MTNKSEKTLRLKIKLNDSILPQREKTVRLIFIALGIMILGYIYTESLWAQQAAQQRISISQAVDFPSDI